MKIDLHVHASERSGCSVSSEHDLIAAARAVGLDALCFTDHHAYIETDQLQALNRRYAPFRIYFGIEITTCEEEDILVYGVREPALQQRNWHYADLHTLVREQNGALILAHPYRYRDHLNIDVEKCPPDAVEICSINIRPCNYPRIRSLCQHLGVPAVCTSDAHNVINISESCVEFDEEAADEQMLAAWIRAGQFHCIKPGYDES